MTYINVGLLEQHKALTALFSLWLKKYALFSLSFHKYALFLLSLQKYVRAYILRLRYVKLKKGVIHLQAIVRGVLLRNRIKRWHQSATKIQSNTEDTVTQSRREEASWEWRKLWRWFRQNGGNSKDDKGWNITGDINLITIWICLI